MYTLKTIYRNKKENNPQDVGGKNMILNGYTTEALVSYIKDHLSSKMVFISSPNKWITTDKSYPAMMNDISELNPIIEGINDTSHYKYSLIRVDVRTELIDGTIRKNLSINVNGYDSEDVIYDTIINDEYDNRIDGVYYFINRNMSDDVTLQIHNDIIECLPDVDIKFRPRPFHIRVHSTLDYDGRMRFNETFTKMKKVGVRISLSGHEVIIALHDVKMLNKVKLLQPDLLKHCYRVDYGMGLIQTYTEENL